MIKETTSHGAGLRADSYSYISAAESIRLGHGYARPSGPEEFNPITNFPPLYPYTIALVQILGIKAYPSARILSGLFFGITLALSGIALRMATRSMIWSLYGVLLILSSPVLIELFSYAQSEPLFLMMTVLGFLLLAPSFSSDRTRRRLVLLVGSALVISGIMMTRYIGIAAVITGIYVTWLQGSSSARKQRYFWGLLFGLITTFPMIVFLIRNYFVAGDFTNRPAPFWHPPDYERLMVARNAIAKWLIPHPIDGTLSSTTVWIAFSVTSLAFFGVMLFALLKSIKIIGTEQPVNSFRLLHSIYFFIYLFLLLATVYFFDSLTPLNDRLLSPLLFSCIVVGVSLFAAGWHQSGQVGRTVLVLVAAYLLMNNLVQSRKLVPTLLATPQGLASPIYQSSQTLEFVRDRSEESVYTNNIPALYFWADRLALAIPSRVNPYEPEETNAEYYSSLEAMRKDILEEEAILVIIGTNPSGRLGETQWMEVTRGLEILAEFRDGIVFGAPGSASMDD